MSRKEKLNKFINENNFDAVLITDEYNMHYLSGAVYEGVFFGTNSKNYILTDSRYTEVAERDAVECEVITVTTDYVSKVKELCDVHSVKILGFEDNNLTYSIFKKYNEIGVKLVELGSCIDEFRKIKDEYELECLEKAEHIGDKAFDYVLGIIKPGITEMDIAIEIEMALKRNGAEALSFDTIVASGINGSMPHAVPTQKVVEYGELITMDFGCKYKGYCSDMTRTIMLGKADNKQREIYNTVLEAQLKALEFIKAGVKGKDVDRVARDVIESKGYGKYFGHGLGHSVGLFIHENPNLSPREERVIEENMIETVEPGIYIPKFGGVRIEDMVAVTKEGCKNLTTSPKHLIEI